MHVSILTKNFTQNFLYINDLVKVYIMFTKVIMINYISYLLPKITKHD